MELTTLILNSILTLTPIQKDTTKINFEIPKIKPTTITQTKIQYEIPLTKKTFFFTEYESPQKMQILKKEIPYISTGIKIKF